MIDRAKSYVNATARPDPTVFVVTAGFGVAVVAFEYNVASVVAVPVVYLSAVPWNWIAGALRRWRGRGRGRRERPHVVARHRVARQVLHAGRPARDRNGVGGRVRQRRGEGQRRRVVAGRVVQRRCDGGVRGILDEH